MHMKISVVIVNYKTPKLLLKCIASLKKAAPFVDDIIAVDQASGDNSIELVKNAYPDVKTVGKCHQWRFWDGFKLWNELCQA